VRLFDYSCPSCRRVERDVHVRVGHAVQVDCLACLQPMVRLFNAVPQVWHTGGRGGQP
jgi:hypothetical protein